MKICPNCQHEQATGNFCGKCGEPLDVENVSSANPEQASTMSSSTRPQTSDQVNKLKNESKQFFHFLAAQLKSPSSHMETGTNSYKNSLLSIITYILLTAFAAFFLTRSLTSFSYNYLDISFFNVIMPLVLLSLLLIVVNLAAIYVTAKLFSDNLSFKDVIQKTGGYFAIPLALTAISFVLILIKAYTMSFLILGAGAALAFGTIPMFVMITLLAKSSKGLDKFYSFLFFIVFISIAGSLVSLLLMDSQIGELIRYM